MKKYTDRELANFISRLIDSEAARKDADTRLIEELEKQLSELAGGSEKPHRKVKPKSLRGITAAAAAAAILTLSVGAITGNFVPAKIRDEVGNAAELPAGESYTKDGVDYTNTGKRVIYNSIGEFRAESQIDIRFFGELPEGVKICEISRSETGYLPLDVSFSGGISFMIYENPAITAEKARIGLSTYEINGYTWYVNENAFIGFMYHDGLIYQVNAPSIESLLAMLKSFE